MRPSSALVATIVALLAVPAGTAAAATAPLTTAPSTTTQPTTTQPTTAASSTPSPAAIPDPDLGDLPPPARRHVEETRQRLAEALAADADDPAVAQGFLFLGRILYAYELPAAAAASLTSALERNPRDLDAHYLRALARSSLGDHAGAVDDLRVVARTNTEAVAPLLRLGDELLALGDAETALEATGDTDAARHERTLGGDVPFSFPDPVAEGVRQIQAVTAFETVREMAGREPADFDEAAFLDFVLSRFGRTPDPLFKLRGLLAQLDAAAADGPAADTASARTRGRLRYAVGGLLLRDGRLDEAVPELQRAVELAPELRDARLQLGNALAQRGDFEGALAQYDALLARQLDNAQALVKRAAARANLGSRDKAPPASWRPAVRADLERAAAGAHSDSPADRGSAAEAHALLARLDQAAGRVDSAAEHYRLALAADPENTAALDGLARLLGSRGRYAEAAELFHRLSAVEPRDPDARMGEAVARLLAGDYAAARAGLEQAVAAQPDEVPLKAKLARLLASSPDHAVRDGERAVALAQEVFTAAPDSASVETLAMAFAEAGDLENAVRWQKRLLSAAGDGADEALRDRWQANLERYESGRSCCAGEDEPSPGAESP